MWWSCGIDEPYQRLKNKLCIIKYISLKSGHIVLVGFHLLRCSDVACGILMCIFKLLYYNFSKE